MLQELLQQAVGIVGSLFTLIGFLGVAYKSSERFRNWTKDLLSVPKRVATVESSVTAAARKNEILFKAMGIAEFKADFDGQVLAVSDEYCRLVGRSPNDCLGWGWVEFIKLNVDEWRRLILMRVPIRLHVEVNGKPLILIAQPLDKVSYYGIITNESNL